MLRKLAAAVVIMGLGLGSGDSVAQDRVTLGWGRMFSNDGIGDGKDRWRTGSYTISRVRGRSWSGALPATFGEILEFRARTDIIAPESLRFVPPGDRRYAGVLTFGLHTHFDMKGFETSLGADLAITGPQNRLSDVQEALHDIFGATPPLVASSQIPNGFYPTLVVETGRRFDLGGTAHLRPFVEVQAGLETFVRGGFDLSFGSYGSGALMLRDQASGQRYRAVAGGLTPGLTFSLGGDIARVFDSAILPDGGAAVLSDTRSRLRAGVAWQGERASAFYGLSWLGREFEGQRDDQLVGSLSLTLRF
ncbi:MAG: lipid A deacylase LpxR family protein [Rhodobacter sp.]|jgi:hypothetical protein|nr:lipid A deacylase LpxR family protein [Rhodobacter sp.]MBK8439511.1 lipid A deacylase LpxR family protein [Rhodobacter sp.]